MTRPGAKCDRTSPRSDAHRLAGDRVIVLSQGTKQIWKRAKIKTLRRGRDMMLQDDCRVSHENVCLAPLDIETNDLSSYDARLGAKVLSITPPP